jgi:ribosome maturation factor RimP
VEEVGRTMTPQESVSRLISLLEPRAISEGFELVAVEVAGSAATPIVRVYLDREGGLDIDAIAAANAWIKELLETALEISGDYTLEVSSPGIERPLRTRADYVRFTGSMAKITTRELVGGRRSFCGIITGVEHDAVSLDIDGNTHAIPLGTIDKARLRVEIDFNKEGLDGI